MAIIQNLHYFIDISKTSPFFPSVYLLAKCRCAKFYNNNFGFDCYSHVCYWFARIVQITYLKLNFFPSCKTRIVNLVGPVYLRVI